MRPNELIIAFLCGVVFTVLLFFLWDYGSRRRRALLEFPVLIQRLEFLIAFEDDGSTARVIRRSTIRAQVDGISTSVVKGGLHSSGHLHLGMVRVGDTTFQ